MGALVHGGEKGGGLTRVRRLGETGTLASALWCQPVLVPVLGAHRELTTLTQAVRLGSPGGLAAAAGTDSPLVCVHDISLSSSWESPCSPPPPSPKHGVGPTAGAWLLRALSKAGVPKAQRPSEMTDTQEDRLCRVAGGDPLVNHEVRCKS